MTDRAAEHKRRMKAQRILKDFAEPKKDGYATLIVRMTDLIALGLKVEEARHARQSQRSGR